MNHNCDVRVQHVKLIDHAGQPVLGQRNWARDHDLFLMQVCDDGLGRLVNFSQSMAYRGQICLSQRRQGKATRIAREQRPADKFLKRSHMIANS